MKDTYLQAGNEQRPAEPARDDWASGTQVQVVYGLEPRQHHLADVIELVDAESCKVRWSDPDMSALFDDGVGTVPLSDVRSVEDEADTLARGENYLKYTDVLYGFAYIDALQDPDQSARCPISLSDSARPS